ncbi:hypothetical protein Sru01_33330 [Sphaerisporangium rufum]|uniref:Uncharacterized protein n=1 Tax=Sphaerisporangium rufum TaxID=1381558 RepID=A0A919R268_9ACTN|nr:hypothetical protein [Sphaerisporangium rufum]GII78351.1 hypothetical protein Sru01_33330 [Sphaerisporangium rufum]
MAPLRARTLQEAYLYVTLTASQAAGDDAPVRTAGDYDARTTRAEGPDAWTVGFDGRPLGLPLVFEIVVSYRAEAAARRDGLPYGPGASPIIDAGQWRAVSGGYARAALRDELRLDAGDPVPDGAGPAERVRGVMLGWEAARDSAAEAARFLPAGAAEVPLSAFWTPMGKAVRQKQPELFTREALERDIAAYERARADVILDHTGGRS